MHWASKFKICLLFFSLIIFSTNVYAYQQSSPQAPEYANQYNSNARETYPSSKKYNLNEITRSGKNFFGETTGGLGTVFAKIFSHYGSPSAYITGTEGSGAFLAGLTYGNGILHMKGGESFRVYWTGPSIGFDAGGNGSCIMILVYNLNNPGRLWGRYAGVSGSAYIIAGAGFTVLQKDNILLVPVRTGVGARFGANIGYLKLTPRKTINPF